MATKSGALPAVLGPLGALHHSFKALIGYCALAAALFAPLLLRIPTHILADDRFIRPGQSDAFTNLWTYWWTQKALLTGRDILHCTWVLPPTGADLLFHSTSLTPTLLSLPFARLFGVVAGYNLMVIFLIVGAAWMYYLFLSRTFPVSRLSAFWTGALFGFCPYFVFKTHAHINLIGACFWGGTLAVLVHSYLAARFNIRDAFLFALLLWATFWTSFVEFFMLVIMLPFVILALEIATRGDRAVSLRRKLLFLLPACLGAAPAAPLLRHAQPGAVSMPLFPGLGITGLLTFPRLSILSGFGHHQVPEYWGTYLPIAVLVLGVTALCTRRAISTKVITLSLIPAALALLLTLNPFDLSSTAIRALPMGEGFRVFARFFPFLLFFWLIPTCHGLDFIFRQTRSLARAAVLSALLVLAIVEYLPAKLSPSPVKSFHIDSETRAHLDRDKYVLVIPAREYLNVHDTYQAALDMRCVHLSYVAREDQSVAASRRERFPIMYDGRRVVDPDDLRRELKELQVRYLLFEDRARVRGFPLTGRVVTEDNGQALVDISNSL